jgi:mono/diheme cytochrome c family protein
MRINVSEWYYRSSELRRQSWRKLMRILALIGALAIAVAIGAAIFFFGGFYSVAATAAEPGIINWALVNVRVASINRHAIDNPQVSLDNPSTVPAGARAFAARGCLNCHGGPGVKWAKFTEGMLPYPPDLKDIAKDREPPQLFWVVKNGIRMTGMPSFGSIGVSDQEIWTIVAFVKKLPTVSEADFKAWTAAP